ncbi:MAG: hypothetical protein HZB42_09730 [Sphingobacteriales bacterium]|nr:hypothetical protein [Sphingobacteriales bacterium]
MNRFLLLLASIIILASCNDNKPKEKDEAVTKPVNNADQMKNAVQDMEKQKEELSKLTPIPPDQLKTMAPETLLGAARTNLDANDAMGATLITADYELNDSSSATLTIYDCAGPGGAGIYSMQYLGLLNIKEDNEEEYTKSVEFNGTTAFEHCDKTTNDCAFTFFAGGRYLVTIEAANVSMDALKQAAAGLNIK